MKVLTIKVEKLEDEEFHNSGHFYKVWCLEYPGLFGLGEKEEDALEDLKIDIEYVDAFGF